MHASYQRQQTGSRGHRLQRRFRAQCMTVALAMLSGASATFGQAVDGGYPLFASGAPLALKIEGPFREIARMNRDRPEFAGRLTYRTDDGQDVGLDLEMRIRGNSRLALCRFPPLRLDFVRSQLGGTVFAGQNRLKLATLCRQEERYRDYLGLEFAVYRMFNALTDRSFRVRWASIEYVPTDDRRGEPFTEPAFLIEEDWEVAERHGMQVVEVERLGVRELDRRQTALLGVFQFVIGNTDWAGLEGPAGEPCCHNGKVMRSPDDAYILLPYDFDQSGLVDAVYAQPNPALPIRSVRQRFYRGYCEMNAEIDGAVARFNERRSLLEEALAAAPISPRAQEKALAYLNISYEILNDSERLNEEVIEECRG